MAGYGIQKKGTGRAMMKKGGRSFPDLTGDGKTTYADVLKGRGVFNIGGRANLLEEMGRIDSEKMNPNRRAEKRRVISELNRGYKKGGRIGFKDGTKMVEIPVNKPTGRGGRMSIEKVPAGGKKHMRYLKSKTNPDSPFFVRKPMKKGGKVPKGYHRTKDGRVAKKGLYYYMNRAKKRGTSKPGKGSVSDKALKQSAKTAKK